MMAATGSKPATPAPAAPTAQPAPPTAVPPTVVPPTVVPPTAVPAPLSPNQRLAQAREVGADTVATACPFCLGMLEDAAKSAGDTPPRIVDLAELVAAGLPDDG